MKPELKPISKLTIIKEQNSKAFIKEFNKNKISNQLLDSCRKAGQLFGSGKEKK